MANIITIPDGAIVEDIDIYIDKQNKIPYVNARQYDTGMRYIRASIWNNGDFYPMLETDVICLTATKPDRVPLFNTAGIDVDGKIVYEMTDQTTSAFGTFIAEFRIYNTKIVDEQTVNTLKTTYDFKMIVAKSNVQDTEIISTPEFNALTDAMASVGDLTTDVNDAITRANTAIDNIETALIDVNTATTNANNAVTLANNAATLANEKAGLADTATTNAINATTSAYNAATLANEKAGLAVTATDNANTATTNAITATGLANNATTNANNVATQLETETLKIFKPSVAIYADLATTYPTPENGWTVTVNGESPITSYRYNGTEWINLGVISSVDTATNTALGVVRGGDNVNVGIDGTLSVPKVGDLTQLTTTSNTDLVSAINEVNAKTSSGGTAETTTYDNTASGMDATNVQGAIDELKTNLTNMREIYVSTEYPTTEQMVDGSIWIVTGNEFISISDTFTGTDGTSIDATKWETITGGTNVGVSTGITIQNNTASLRTNTTVLNNYVWSHFHNKRVLSLVSGENVRVKADIISNIPTTDGVYFGLTITKEANTGAPAGANTTHTNGIEVFIASQGLLAVQKKVSGVATALYTQAGAFTGTANIEVITNGNYVNIVYNGTIVFTSESAGFDIGTNPVVTFFRECDRVLNEATVIDNAIIQII